MAGDYPADPTTISGGVEAVVLNLAHALQQYPDLKLDLVTLDRQETTRRIEKHENVTVHYLPSATLPSYLSTLANIRQIRTEMMRLEPDLIHAQVAGEFAEAAAGTGLPWVLTLHGIRFLEVDLWEGFLNKVYRGWFIKRTERRAVKRAQHIISISPFIQATFKGQIRGNVYDIENPIDEAYFQVRQNSQSSQLLFVGRLIPRKGVYTLLRAFALLHRRMPNATLRLAGGEAFSNESRTYPKQLRAFVAEAGLQESVTFLGALDKSALMEEYSNCSALVLSSVLETAPMVIMEAMAAGRAVVSTDAGGARYLVEQGQTGLVVPSEDEEALGEALYQVLCDEDKLQAMGHRAREVAIQRFHAKAVAAQTREVYYHILGKRPLSRYCVKEASGES